MNMRHCFYLPNTGPRTDGDPCSFCGSLLCLGDSECFSGSVSSKSDLCDVVRRDVCDKALHSRWYSRKWWQNRRRGRLYRGSCFLTVFYIWIFKFFQRSHLNFSPLRNRKHTYHTNIGSKNCTTITRPKVTRIRPRFSSSIRQHIPLIFGQNGFGTEVMITFDLALRPDLSVLARDSAIEMTLRGRELRWLDV